MPSPVRCSSRLFLHSLSPALGTVDHPLRLKLCFLGFWDLVFLLHLWFFLLSVLSLFWLEPEQLLKVKGPQSSAPHRLCLLLVLYSHGFRNHLYANDSQIYIYSSALSTPVSFIQITYLTTTHGCLSNIWNVICSKLNSCFFSWELISPWIFSISVNDTSFHIIVEVKTHDGFWFCASHTSTSNPSTKVVDIPPESVFHCHCDNPPATCFLSCRPLIQCSRHSY